MKEKRYILTVDLLWFKRRLERRRQNRLIERRKELEAWADDIEKRAVLGEQVNWIDRLILRQVLKRVEVHMGMLKGYKTYACAAILVVAGGLKSFGLIDEGMYNTVLAIFGPLGLAALRAAKGG